MEEVEEMTRARQRERRGWSLPAVEDAKRHQRDQYVNSTMVMGDTSSQKSRFADFSQSFSAHGVNKIVRSHQLLRSLVWLSVCCFMLGSGTWQCYKVMAEYFQYPKKVTIEMRQEAVTEFPAVTICNLNPLPMKELLRDHSIWQSFIEIEEEYSEPNCDIELGNFDYDYYYGYHYMDYYGGSEASGSSESESTTETESLTETSTETSMKSTETAQTTGGANTVRKKREAVEALTTEPSVTPSTETVLTTGGTNTVRKKKEATTTVESSTEPTVTPSTETVDSSTGGANMVHKKRESVEALTTRSPSHNINGRPQMEKKKTATDPRPPPPPILKAETPPKFPHRLTKLAHHRKVPGHMVRRVETDDEEEEVVGSLVPDGSRGLPLPKDHKRDGIMSFGAFSKMYVKKSTRLPETRTKREDTEPETKSVSKTELKCKVETKSKAETKTESESESETETENQTPPLSAEEIKSVRLACSEYFKHFTKIKESRMDVLESEVTNTTCRMKYYDEHLTFNALCRLNIVADYYGCFDENLREYNETEEVDDSGIWRCPSCASTCWLKEWFTNWEEGNLDIVQLERLYNESKTADFSDLKGVFSPSILDIQTYSLPAETFITTCTYDRRGCSHKWFYNWTSDQYGMCYTYNSALFKVKTANDRTVNARPKLTSSSGPMNGLRLTLNIQTLNYLALLSPEVGVRVIVHNPHQIPFPEDQGFNISPGYSASVSVTKKVVERVGQPHGNCRDTPTSKAFTKYSSIRCQKECLERAYWSECDCYSAKNHPENSDHAQRPQTECSPLNATNNVCKDMVLFSYQQQRLICDCPPACQETMYSTQVTNSKENPIFYSIVQNIKKANVGGDLCSGSDNSTVRLHIYMETLAYEKIEESAAYTWDTLVCNFGGNLGLFLGMSIITLVELLEFFLDMALNALRGKPSPNQQNRPNTVTPNTVTPNTTGLLMTPDEAYQNPERQIYSEVSQSGRKRGNTQHHLYY